MKRRMCFSSAFLPMIEEGWFEMYRMYIHLSYPMILGCCIFLDEHFYLQMHHYLNWMCGHGGYKSALLLSSSNYLRHVYYWTFWVQILKIMWCLWKKIKFYYNVIQFHLCIFGMEMKNCVVGVSPLHLEYMCFPIFRAMHATSNFMVQYFILLYFCNLHHSTSLVG